MPYKLIEDDESPFCCVICRMETNVMVYYDNPSDPERDTFTGVCPNCAGYATVLSLDFIAKNKSIVDLLKDAIKNAIRQGKIRLF